MEGRYYTYFWGLNNIWTYRENRKIKVRYFPGAKIKGMYQYAIPLLEKKLENTILPLGTNDAPYKSDTNILKDMVKLKNFILKKLPNCKK